MVFIATTTENVPENMEKFVFHGEKSQATVTVSSNYSSVMSVQEMFDNGLNNKLSYWRSHWTKTIHDLTVNFLNIKSITKTRDKIKISQLLATRTLVFWYDQSLMIIFIPIQSSTYEAFFLLQRPLWRALFYTLRFKQH